MQGARLVGGEVPAGAVVHQGDDPGENAAGASPRFRWSGPGTGGQAGDDPGDRGGDIRDWQDLVDIAGADRATRHAIEPGLIGVLGDHRAARGLDRTHTLAAVVERTGEHDTDGAGPD